MHYRKGMLLFLQQCTDLKLATNISGCDHLCGRRDDFLDFSFAQLAGRVRLNQIVDAGGTAADRPFGQLY